MFRQNDEKNLRTLFQKAHIISFILDNFPDETVTEQSHLTTRGIFTNICNAIRLQVKNE